jgi:hypothetical protein
MVTLSEIQEKADELSSEDRVGLLSYLIERLTGAPLGPDDSEVARREQDLESGKVSGLSHDEFRSQVGR